MRPAPDFALQDQNGDIHQLSDYVGRWVVLYFYPKDDTPGCTTEACNFRDAREAIAEFGNAEIIGVSADSVTSHKKFAEKHGLNFILLSDPAHKVIEAYESWAPKKMFGREFLGVLRNTFIISPEGTIIKKYEGVDPKEHVGEILKDLKELQTNE